MSKIKVGIVGAGAIARNHIQGVNKHPDAECVAIADPSAERAGALAAEFKLSRTYADARELFRDKGVDAVCLAVPNKHHAPLALAALEAGKHVMLDKPFALNAAEAEQVAAAARGSGKVFTVGMNQRFTMDAQVVKAMVERGDLGEIYYAKAYWFRRSGIPKFGTWFCRKDEAGGGALLDIGVHYLDLCLHLMGNFEPVVVSGASYTKFGTRGLGEGGWGMSERGEQVFDVDDFTTGLIHFKNGATVSLEVSWAIHQETANRNNVELFGTEGGAMVNPKAKLFRYSKERQGEYEALEPQDVKVRYPAQDRSVNWLDAILGKDKLCCPVEQALAVQKILDAIYASAKNGGREVRIG